MHGLCFSPYEEGQKPGDHYVQKHKFEDDWKLSNHIQNGFGPFPALMEMRLFLELRRNLALKRL